MKGVTRLWLANNQICFGFSSIYAQKSNFKSSVYFFFLRSNKVKICEFVQLNILLLGVLCRINISGR